LVVCNYINADTVAPKSATMFSRKGCAHCQRALDILSDVHSFVDAVEDKKVKKNPIQNHSTL
jgi:glutaredoxin